MVIGSSRSFVTFTLFNLTEKVNSTEPPELLAEDVDVLELLLEEFDDEPELELELLLLELDDDAEELVEVELDELLDVDEVVPLVLSELPEPPPPPQATRVAITDKSAIFMLIIFIVSSPSQLIAIDKSQKTEYCLAAKAQDRI